MNELIQRSIYVTQIFVLYLSCMRERTEYNLVIFSFDLRLESFSIRNNIFTDWTTSCVFSWGDADLVGYLLDPDSILEKNIDPDLTKKYGSKSNLIKQDPDRT